MKKTQLRQIIRESIKELMNEQGNTGCNPPETSGLSTSNISMDSAQLNWKMPPASSVSGFEIKIREQGGAFSSAISVSNPANLATSVSDLSSSTTYEWQVRTVCQTGVSDWSDPGMQMGVWDSSFITQTPSQGQCNQSDWDGMSSFMDSFMNLPHFNSTNPDQPCNMICKKKSIWDSKYPNVTHAPQLNQLACKLEVANIAISQHNCSC